VSFAHIIASLVVSYELMVCIAFNNTHVYLCIKQYFVVHVTICR